MLRIMAILALAVIPSAALADGGLLVAQADGACPSKTFSSRVVEGSFQGVECGDLCHLYLKVDGLDVDFLAGGDTQDFEGRIGARVRVKAALEQFLLDGYDEEASCVQTEVAYSIEAIK
jgi:hypothetical protein